MALKIKRQYPYTERFFNVYADCDARYDRAKTSWEKSQREMVQVVRKSIVYSAKKLLTAARLFDQSDPSVKELVAGLTEGVRLSDLISIPRTLRDFRGSIPFPSGEPDGPAAGLVSACDSLLTAVEKWSEGDFSMAQGCTVMCRSALKFTGE